MNDADDFDVFLSAEEVRSLGEHRERCRKAQKSELARCLRDDRLEDAIWLYERHERLERLLHWHHSRRLRGMRLSSLLRDVWPTAEAVGKHAYTDAWVYLFRQAGYVTDTKKKLNGELQVFRGVAWIEEKGGMSWTLDATVADLMAGRNAALASNAPVVYVALVSAVDILGYVRDYGEEEIIVDPSTLRGRRIHCSES